MNPSSAEFSEALPPGFSIEHFQPGKPSMLEEVHPTYPSIEEWPENVIYERYMTAADPAEKEALHAKLITLVTEHMYAITFIKFGENRPDLANQALEAILRQIPKFQGKSKFSTWTEQIIRNICAKEISRLIRDRPFWNQLVQGVVPQNDDGELFLPAEPEHEDILTKLSLDRMKESLTENEQKLLSMMLEGSSGAEIAERLNCSESGARMKKHALRKKLRKLLEGVFE